MQVNEIKGLNAVIANTRRELMKSEEQLEDAKRLQRFLDDLIPEEWKEALVKERDDKHDVQMAIWQAEIDDADQALQVSFPAAPSQASARFLV